MRRILVDNARHKRTLKRGGSIVRHDLGAAELLTPPLRRAAQITRKLLGGRSFPSPEAWADAGRQSGLALQIPVSVSEC